MNMLKTANVLRRKITRKLFRYIGRSKPGQTFEKLPAGEIKHILINRPNKRLGNLLLITPLLQELIHHFPQAKIDLFVKGGLAPLLFKNYEQVDRIIRLPKKPFKELVKYAKVWFRIRQRKYDLVINVDKVSSSGRIATKFAHARYRFFGDENEIKIADHPGASHMAKRPVFLLRENLELPFTSNEKNNIPSLNIRLSGEELNEGKRIVDGLVTPQQKTISIFTYATGAKCYDVQWWQNFYEGLKTMFPGYNFLEILPAENVSQLNFSIPSFYSMDVREIAAVIANTSLFIGADSGMMHLASASQTPTIGLFAVTNRNVYEPYGNKSIGIDTNTMTLPELLVSISNISA